MVSDEKLLKTIRELIEIKLLSKKILLLVQTLYNLPKDDELRRSLLSEIDFFAMLKGNEEDVDVDALTNIVIVDHTGREDTFESIRMMYKPGIIKLEHVGFTVDIFLYDEGRRHQVIVSLV